MRMTREELKQRRSRLGLTQQGLAHALSVVLSTVVRWERKGDFPAYLDLAMNWLESQAPYTVISVTEVQQPITPSHTETPEKKLKLDESQKEILAGKKNLTPIKGIKFKTSD